MNIIRRIAAVTALSMLAAGCANQGSTVRPPVIRPATDSDVQTINTLLLRGEKGEARKLIKSALKLDPQNASVQLLRDSIERDPKELLGPNSFDYKVRSGDTISDLAQRFLGNRLKAYQLARYNDLSAPFTLTAGQTLRIPGSAPRAEPVRRPPTATRPAPAPSAAPSAATPARPAAKPAAPAANPAAARQLRAAGLGALNQGNVTRAVGLLRRAAAADPGNPAIARDLARAERIAATVRARK